MTRAGCTIEAKGQRDKSCVSDSPTHEACAVENSFYDAGYESATAQFAHLFRHFYTTRDDHVVVSYHVFVFVVCATF